MSLAHPSREEGGNFLVQMISNCLPSPRGRRVGVGTLWWYRYHVSVRTVSDPHWFQRWQGGPSTWTWRGSVFAITLKVDCLHFFFLLILLQISISFHLEKRSKMYLEKTSGSKTYLGTRYKSDDEKVAGKTIFGATPMWINLDPDQDPKYCLGIANLLSHCNAQTSVGNPLHFGADPVPGIRTSD